MPGTLSGSDIYGLFGSEFGNATAAARRVISDHDREQGLNDDLSRDSSERRLVKQASRRKRDADVQPHIELEIPAEDPVPEGHNRHEGPASLSVTYLSHVRGRNALTTGPARISGGA